MLPIRFVGAALVAALATVTNAELKVGDRAPEVKIDQWIQGETTVGEGTPYVVEFWATWCGPCKVAIPHMNEIANKFRDKVTCVGLSDESLSSFNSGLQRRGLGPNSFAYSLALDPKGRMKNAFQVRGIPHIAVMSTDWVVRWQGHPSALTEAVVRQIVEADPGVGENPAAGGGEGRPPARWAKRRG